MYNKNKDIILTLFNEKLISFKMIADKDINKFFEKLKIKYGSIDRVRFDNAFFNPETKEYEILGINLREYDDYNILDSYINENSAIITRSNTYKSYSGKVDLIKYPKIYKILNNKFNNQTLKNINDWYNYNDNISVEEKKKIIGEYFKYIELENPEILRVDSYRQIFDQYYVNDIINIGTFKNNITLKTLLTKKIINSIRNKRLNSRKNNNVVSKVKKLLYK